MQIGEVIRNHRKEKGMTQEEMADRLGVTAPAVNKWENGNSMPDILLLAPIARLLDITLEELLSFREELTQEEINGFVREMGERLKREPFGDVFDWVKKKVEEYPNCENLIWQAAAVLNARMLTDTVEHREIYEGVVEQWFVRALESRDEKIRVNAADCLFGFYMRREEYEKAESYLSYMSDQNPEKKRKQAMIYGKMGRLKEAYRTYEELLFSGYTNISLVLHGMFMLAMENEDRERARMLSQKQSQAAELFDMGKYSQASVGLDLAVAEKDVESTIRIIKEMVANIHDLCHYCTSPLYEHIKFKEINKEFLKEVKGNLLSCLRDEETFGFLKEDRRWQQLVGTGDLDETDTTLMEE